MSLLEINDLVCHAGDKTILDGFSLAMEASEVHALLGTNGTGKSTLACLIMGCGGRRIGSVDKRQLETLMAHGFSPEEAVDVIVKGILK